MRLELTVTKFVVSLQSTVWMGEAGRHEAHHHEAGHTFAVGAPFPAHFVCHNALLPRHESRIAHECSILGRVGVVE